MVHGIDAAQTTIEAELKVPMATVCVVQYDMFPPLGDSFLRQAADSYYLDLAITQRPANTRLCFQDHWEAHRFETPGRVFLVPPGKTVKARSEAGRQMSVTCQLEKNFFQQWLDREFEWTDRRLEASLHVPTEMIEPLLLNLGEEARHPGFASGAMTEAMVMQIAIALSRYYFSVSDRLTAGGLSPWRLRLIDERLVELRSPPTLTELASLCGLSVRQLTRGFRSSRDCSIGDYIARTRIENAKRLLATGERIKSIAFSMGFGSPSSFCHAFRSATGSTPQQYRLKTTQAGGRALI